MMRMGEWEKPADRKFYSRISSGVIPASSLQIVPAGSLTHMPSCSLPWRAVVCFCNQQFCEPVVSCHSAQLLTVQELVALGRGISLIPQMAVDADKSKRRKYRSLHGNKPMRTIALIWRKGRAQSPLVKRFIEAVQRAASRSSRPARILS
jgi:DNA-binding transcriptional LysR family regulator